MGEITPDPYDGSNGPRRTNIQNRQHVSVETMASRRRLAYVIHGSLPRVFESLLLQQVSKPN